MTARKAEDAVLGSAALAELWQRPISAADLQAELDRIARGTRRPEILQREIGDRHLIADERVPVP